MKPHETHRRFTCNGLRTSLTLPTKCHSLAMTNGFVCCSVDSDGHGRCMSPIAASTRRCNRSWSAFSAVASSAVFSLLVCTIIQTPKGMITRDRMFLLRARHSRTKSCADGKGIVMRSGCVCKKNSACVGVFTDTRPSALMVGPRTSDPLLTTRVCDPSPRLEGTSSNCMALS